MATSLTAERDIQFRNIQNATVYEALVATSAVIYKGSLVFYLAAGTVTADIASGTAFAGVAMNTVTGDGTVKVKLRGGCDARLPIESDVTVADLFLTTLYAVSDSSVAEASVLGMRVGFLTELESSTVGWVRLVDGMRADAGAAGATV